MRCQTLREELWQDWHLGSDEIGNLITFSSITKVSIGFS